MANIMKASGLRGQESRAVRRRGAKSLSFVTLLCALAGCERNDMHNQPRHEPHEPSAFFDDGQASRPLVTGTIARGQLTASDMRYNGLAPAGEQPPDTFPFEITRADLLRGQQRYNIYCSVCHGVDGDGKGMIVQRGFTPPPSLHEQRLKDAPAGHFFNVITNGWGAMYSYNDRVFPEDRWRIIAYIRTLQLSQSDAVASAAGAAGQPQRGAAGGATTGEAPADNEAVQSAVDQVKRAADAAVEQQDQPQPQQDPDAQPQQPPTPPQQPGAPQ